MGAGGGWVVYLDGGSLYCRNPASRCANAFREFFEGCLVQVDKIPVNGAPLVAELQLFDPLEFHPARVKVNEIVYTPLQSYRLQPKGP